MKKSPVTVCLIDTGIASLPELQRPCGGALRSDARMAGSFENRRGRISFLTALPAPTSCVDTLLRQRSSIMRVMNLYRDNRPCETGGGTGMSQIEQKWDILNIGVGQKDLGSAHRGVD